MPPPASDLPDIAHDLYGLPLAEFTRIRDQQAAQLRRDGDRELATAVGSLRRPSVAAWAVNRLVRERPEQLDALFALGADLRAAQETLDGDELRLLNRRQHQVVAALRREVDALAVGAGRPLSDAVGRQVEATVRAGMADPAAAAAIRTGLLLRELVSSGFEPVDLAGAVAVGVPGGEPHGDDAPASRAGTRRARRRQGPEDARGTDGARTAKEQRRADRAREAEEQRRAAEARRAEEVRRARERQAEAETHRATAHQELVAAQEAEQVAADRRDQLSARVDELRARLEALEGERDDAVRDVDVARARRAEASATAAAADEAAAQAQARLDDLLPR